MTKTAKGILKPNCPQGYGNRILEIGTHWASCPPVKTMCKPKSRGREKPAQARRFLRVPRLQSMEDVFKTQRRNDNGKRREGLYAKPCYDNHTELQRNEIGMGGTNLVLLKEGSPESGTKNEEHNQGHPKDPNIVTLTEGKKITGGGGQIRV